MTIIGTNTFLDTPAEFNLTTPKLLYGSGQQAVLPANQKIVAAHIGWGGVGRGGAGTVEIGLYDYGNASAAKPIIAESVVQVPFDNAVLSAVGGNQWLSVTGLNIDISAHAGKTLAPGIASPSGSGSGSAGFEILLGAVTGAVRGNSNAGTSRTLPSTITVGTTSNNQAWSVYFETETIAADVSLDGVTPGAVTNIGTITAIISGNAASGSVKLIAGGVEVLQAVTSWSYNAGTDKTTVIAGVVQGGLAFGVVTVRISSGGIDLDDDIELVPISGNVQVAISGAMDEPGYIFNQLEAGNLADITHIEHDDSPNTVVSASGLITQTILRNFTARARDGSDNTWGSFATIAPYILFEGSISEQLPASVDSMSATFSEPEFNAEITEELPGATDAITGVVYGPGYNAIIDELLPAAVDSIAATFIAPEFFGAIAELNPASIDSIAATFSAPEFNAEISEVLPGAIDAIAGVFVAASGGGAITEFVPAAVDALSATAAVPQYVAALAEVLPAATDAVQAASKEIVYHPSAERTLFIEPESRVLLIAP